MSYSIIKLGGKQYKVSKGDKLIVDKVSHPEGEKFEVTDVLLTSDGNTPKIGSPLVKGEKVSLKVLKQFKGKKLIVSKFKSKSKYRRKQGHRQHLSKLEVISI